MVPLLFQSKASNASLKAWISSQVWNAISETIISMIMIHSKDKKMMTNINHKKLLKLEYLIPSVLSEPTTCVYLFSDHISDGEIG